MAAFSKKGYECWDLGAPPQEQADACLYRGVDTVTVILSVYRSRLRLRFGTVPYNILQIRPPSLDCCRWRNYVIPCRTRTSRPELAVSATMDEATASASVPAMVGDPENSETVGVNGNANIGGSAWPCPHAAGHEHALAMPNA